MITAEERQRARADAWLVPSAVQFGPVKCRPLSLGSMILLDRLGIDFQKCNDPDWAEDMVLRYLWAHGEDLETVLWCTFAGTWEKAMVEYEWTVDVEALVPPVVSYVARIFSMLDVLWVKIHQRPKSPGGELPPPDLLAPDFMAALVADAGACLPGMSEQALVWEMPVPRIVSYHHVERWKNSEWTVPFIGTRGTDEQIKAAQAALEAARAHVAPAPESSAASALSLLDRLTSK